MLLCSLYSGLGGNEVIIPPAASQCDRWKLPRPSSCCQAPCQGRDLLDNNVVTITQPRAKTRREEDHSRGKKSHASLDQYRRYCEQFSIQTRNKSLNIIWPLLTKNMNIPTIYPCFLSPRTGHWYRLGVVQSAPNLTRAKLSRSLPREGQNLVLRIWERPCFNFVPERVLWSLSFMAVVTKWYPLVFCFKCEKIHIQNMLKPSTSHQDSQEHFVLKITRNPSSREFYQKIHLSSGASGRGKITRFLVIVLESFTWGGRIHVILAILLTFLKLWLGSCREDTTFAFIEASNEDLENWEREKDRKSKNSKWWNIHQTPAWPVCSLGWSWQSWLESVWSLESAEEQEARAEEVLHK